MDITVLDPDPEIRRGGAVPKKIFSALQTSVLSKNKGGPLPYKCRSATALWTSCEKHISHLAVIKMHFKMVVCLNSTFKWKNYSNQEQTMVKTVL